MGLEDQQRFIFRAVGYEPTPAQWKVHLDQTRNKLVTGGERAGKSKVNAGELLSHWYIEHCVPEIKGGLFWILAADYESCRGEWEHIVEHFTRLDQIKHLTKSIDPAQMILKDDTTIITKSAKYPEKIATVAPNGILIAEAAQVDYDIFLRARSRLAEKRGWLSMAGTLEEEMYTSWYSELYELGQSYNALELKSFSIPSWENIIIFPEGRNDPELLSLEQSMTPERFMERFGAIPAPKTGRVVTAFSNAVHVCPCEFVKDLEVEIGVDVGYRGAYAVVAVQKKAEHLEVIDEVYLQGYVTEDIITICQKKAWWDNVVGGAIDIAGTQHQGMTSPHEIWLSKGGKSLMFKKVNVDDGIDLLNTHLKQHPVTGQAGIVIDPKARGLISEMGGGKSPVEGGGTWMRDKNLNTPLRKNDHACKALIYLLANKYFYTMKNDSRLFRPRFVGKPASQTFLRGR